MQTRGWICDSQLQHFKLKKKYQLQILFFPSCYYAFDFAHFIFSLKFVFVYSETLIFSFMASEF